MAAGGARVGLVSSISYESTRPFDKQLDDLSISLNEHSSLRDLLGQVKGTPVQVEILRHGKRDLVEGTVIGTLLATSFYFPLPPSTGSLVQARGRSSLLPVLHRPRAEDVGEAELA